MENPFASKSAKILIVDTAAAVRQLLADALKENGFKNINSVASLTEGLELLEAEPIDWLLTSLAPEGEVNAMQILRLCTKEALLYKLNISLFLEADQTSCLNNAFELGLMSWHPAVNTADAAKKEIKKLTSVLEAKNGNTCLISAHYLWEWLVSQKAESALLDFSQSLIQTFPGNPELLLYLGEAQLRNTNPGGFRILQQAQLMGPSLKEQVQNLMAAFRDIKPAEISNTTSTNVLGLSNVVVVDPDSAMRKAITQALTELGVSEVREFVDGQEAWEAVKDGEAPQLLITEWVLPKLSAPMLVQRLHQQGFHKTPVLVFSSSIRISDLPTLHEAGIIHSVTKPLETQKVIDAVVWSVKEDRQPTELRIIEKKIVDHMNKGERDISLDLRTRFIEDKNVPQWRKMLVDAELALTDRKYELARDLAANALMQGGDGLRGLSVLGKALMKLRDFDQAILVLEKAKSFSPLNIERLCLIAESYSETDNHEKAQKVLEEASGIDEGNGEVQVAKIKCALSQGNVDAAKKAMAGFDSFENVIGYLNNRAVALASAGRSPEAMQLYQHALETIPEEQKEFVLIVSYNLALAYLRDRAPQEAVTQLAKAEGGESPIAKKMQNLKRQVENALSKGKEIRLTTKESAPSEAKTEETAPAETAETVERMTSYQELGSSLLLKKGDLNCFKIYAYKGKTPDMVGKLLKQEPRFVPRETLKKGLGQMVGKKSA